jgi:cytochrome c551/c552
MKIINVVAAASLMLGGSALAAELPALSKKHGCDVCHDIDKRLVGPAWMDVTKKYKGATKYSYGGKEYALEDGLVIKVSKGGSGNWGSMPMPANDQNGIKQAEIRELVKSVLGLAK